MNDLLHPWELSGRVTNTLLKFLILKPLAFLYRRVRRSLPRFAFKRRTPLPGRKRRNQ